MTDSLHFLTTKLEEDGKNFLICNSWSIKTDLARYNWPGSYQNPITRPFATKSGVLDEQRKDLPSENRPLHRFTGRRRFRRCLLLILPVYLQLSQSKPTCYAVLNCTVLTSEKQRVFSRRCNHPIDSNLHITMRFFQCCNHSYILCS